MKAIAICGSPRKDGNTEAIWVEDRAGMVDRQTSF